MDPITTSRRWTRWCRHGIRCLVVALVAASVGVAAGPGAGGLPADPVQAGPLVAPPPPQNLGPVVSIPPTRVLDTRASGGSIVTTGFDGTTGAAITAGQLQGGTIRRFLINGKTFPQGTGTFTFPTTYGILANVTIVGPAGGGFVTVFPGNVADADRPNASTVNPSTGIAFDFTAVGIAPSGTAPNVGTIAIFTTLTLDVIVDVVGYFTAPDSQSWSLTGNALTNPTTNFLGTTDAQPLVVRTNNAEAMRVLSNGNLGVGTTGPIARLEASDLAGGIGLLGTSTARGIVGRLGGGTSCPGTYAVGGCAGANSATGVLGDSPIRGVLGSLSGAGCASTAYGVGGCGGANGIGTLGDSASRGVVGVLNAGSCPGTYGVGGCGGTTGDGVVGRSAVPANSFTAAAFHGFNSGGGDIFIGESGGASVRVARIDGTGRGFFNGGTQGSGADYADLMPASDGAADLEPGDVLAIDPDAGFAVRRSHEANSSLVAGVYSTKPSMLGVGDQPFDAAVLDGVPVALVGIVPTKVSAENGPIRPGDLLTTASLPGHAMRSTARETGTLIGKALQPLPEGTGVILVLVTLR